MNNTTRPTEQECMQNTFNTVWAHSAQMTERSFDQSKDACMYRAPDGNRCFIGALFPDSLYDLNMEEKNPDALLEDFDLESFFIENGLTTDANILRQLQRIHDTGFYSRKGKLLQFAQEHNLSVPN